MITVVACVCVAFALFCSDDTPSVVLLVLLAWLVFA
jgi:hypothetical protein